VRVVQISDTHLSAEQGVPDQLQKLLDWIVADPPDLLVHTGDIVWEDPDLASDRAFARGVLSGLPCDVVFIPGNHDVGFFETARFPDRLAAFGDTWGGDRFVRDVDTGWRLVGVDVYAVGEPASDHWLMSALDTARPVALFVHQPIDGEPEDGWQLPDPVRDRLRRAVARRGVRVIASGHRHCAVARRPPGSDTDCTHVWAPSTTLTGSPHHGGNPAPGAVEYRFGHDGGWSSSFVRFS
jgi:3',5'-cyclic AMP phosphodiesterase CpdA